MADWERRDGETEPAFEAFRVYRDMGAVRTTRGVAQVLGKSAQLIGRWSSTHDWVARARAFDNQRDAEHLDATAEQEAELLSRLLDSAELMRHRAHQVLASAEDISPALAVRMLEAAAKILATRRGIKTDEPDHQATVDVVALATELMNRGRSPQS
ncbi:hypothetical protein OHR86_22435 [Streptomyces sp. NBC_00441]|uniref:hypothetical protein n=1 Tax=Streptomyces sp. NBC_00441 TaxID=2975742 RepID=UPI002E2B5C7E|nr:hypothetical protein [Streptomyces sp. NBC_00441]